jgi:signal transduction histidine kinase
LGLRVKTLALGAIALSLTLLAMGSAWLELRRALLFDWGHQVVKHHLLYRKQRLDSLIEREVLVASQIAESPVIHVWIRDQDRDPAKRRAAFAELDRIGRHFSSGKRTLALASTNRYYANLPSEGLNNIVNLGMLSLANLEDAWFYQQLERFRAIDAPAYIVTVNPQYPQPILRLWVSLPLRVDGHVAGVVGTGLELDPLLDSNELDTQHHQTLLIPPPTQSLGASMPSNRDPIKVWRADGPVTLAVPQIRQALAAVSQNPKRVETLSVASGSHKQVAGVTRFDTIDWSLAIITAAPQVSIARSLLAPLTLLLITLGLFFLVLAVGINQLIVNPINQLAEAANSLRQKKQQVRLARDRNDEIGALSRAFAAMDAEVRHQAHELEHKVAARTAEAQAARESAEAALLVERTSLRQYRRFAELITHEFRNPLATIKAAAELSQLRAELGKPAEEVTWQRIERAANRLDCLFSQWLESGSLVSAEIPYHPQRITAANLIEDLQRYLPAAPDHLIHSHPPAGDCTLIGDPALLRMALLNLIDNAIKYSAPGSTIEVGVETAGERIGLYVADQGPGIPVEQQKRIFEAHHRLTGSSDKPGLGLGLHLVHRIIDVHRGEVNVQSIPGHGSRFTLWLTDNRPSLGTEPDHHAQRLERLPDHDSRRRGRS